MTRPVYRFEAIDETLDLVPLAGRRALDRAGRKVGLEGWRKLSLAARAAIVAEGAAETVDVGRVLVHLSSAETSAAEGRAEPDPTTVPEVVSRAMGPALTVDRWAALGALDRWALVSLASRGRTDGLGALLAELGVT